MSPSTTPDANVSPKKTQRKVLAASDTSSSSRIRVSSRSSLRWKATVTGCTSRSPMTLAMWMKTIHSYMRAPLTTVCARRRGQTNAVALRTLFEQRPIPTTPVRGRVVGALQEGQQCGVRVGRGPHGLVRQDEFAACVDPSGRLRSDRRASETGGWGHRIGIELGLGRVFAPEPETRGDQLV